MGWNTMSGNGNPHPVLQGITKAADGNWLDFYFVHSFVFECKDKKDVAGWCDYGGNFTAMVTKDNIIGAQFHPEKSGKTGEKILTNFLNL